MIAPDIEIKTNDTYPPIRGQALSKQDRAPIDLTGATVRFHMKDTAENVIVDASASIESPPTNGYVRYEWDAADTVNPGRYCGEFEVTLASGDIFTVPAGDNYIKIYIGEDIA